MVDCEAMGNDVVVAECDVSIDKDSQPLRDSKAKHPPSDGKGQSFFEIWFGSVRILSSLNYGSR